MDFILPLSVQLWMHWWRHNVVRTKTWSPGRVCHVMFLPRCDVLCASITVQTTKNGIYLFYTIKNNPKGLSNLLGHGKKKKITVCWRDLTPSMCLSSFRSWARTNENCLYKSRDCIISNSFYSIVFLRWRLRGRTWHKKET